MSPGATLPGVVHCRIELADTTLHYVTAGTSGPPVLLVHGFPETWWAFRELIPLLAEDHRVVAVDLRGFGDSAIASGNTGSAVAAEDLRLLVEAVDLGPVHVVGQDIAGATVVRLAVSHPGLVRSLTAIEMGLPGFGMEVLADVTHGGTWYIGVLAAPGIPEMLLAGREREFLGDWLFPGMTADPQAVTEDDVDEFVRTYSRSGGWRGACGLYRSMLSEGAEIRALVDDGGLTMPVLAVGGGGGPFTAQTMRQVSAGRFDEVELDGVGHYVALEAPKALSEALRTFVALVETQV